ncbi:hypothetical protein DL98DRAFT_643573 [Cadophora sp. DSE1049]|nr:hypothetical protein DL98DRAFT_643573 [Cadophora sp. DSE1049]
MVKVRNSRRVDRGVFETVEHEIKVITIDIASNPKYPNYPHPLRDTFEDKGDSRYKSTIFYDIAAANIESFQARHGICEDFPSTKTPPVLPQPPKLTLLIHRYSHITIFEMAPSKVPDAKRIGKIVSSQSIEHRYLTRSRGSIDEINEALRLFTFELPDPNEDLSVQGYTLQEFTLFSKLPVLISPTEVPIETCDIELTRRPVCISGARDFIYLIESVPGSSTPWLARRFPEVFDGISEVTIRLAGIETLDDCKIGISIFKKLRTLNLIQADKMLQSASTAIKRNALKARFFAFRVSLPNYQTTKML